MFLFLVELPDRSNLGPLLPFTKDGWMKEENHKLLNGNSGDSAERVLTFTDFFVFYSFSFISLWRGVF